MTGLEIQLALRKGFGRHLVILLVTMKYYEITSGLTSSIDLFYSLRSFAGNPSKKLLPMLAFVLY